MQFEALNSRLGLACQASDGGAGATKRDISQGLGLGIRQIGKAKKLVHVLVPTKRPECHTS